MPFHIKIARINKKLVIVAYNDHSCLKCAYNRIRSLSIGYQEKPGRAIYDGLFVIIIIMCMCNNYK